MFSPKGARKELAAIDGTSMGRFLNTLMLTHRGSCREHSEAERVVTVK